MGIQIAQDANHKSADKNVQRVCLILKLQETMFVVIPVLRMEVGEKEYTPVFIETSESSKH